MTDARFSGVSTGACIGHVGPKDVAGGPLSKVQDGDVIEIVVDRQQLTGSVNIVAIAGVEVDATQAAEALAARPIHPGLRADYPACPIERACGQHCSSLVAERGAVAFTMWMRSYALSNVAENKGQASCRINLTATSHHSLLQAERLARLNRASKLSLFAIPIQTVQFGSSAEHTEIARDRDKLHALLYASSSVCGRDNMCSGGATSLASELYDASNLRFALSFRRKSAHFPLAHVKTQIVEADKHCVTAWQSVNCLGILNAVGLLRFTELPGSDCLLRDSIHQSNN